MVLQNYQNFIEMTSNMIYIVAFDVGLKCPRKIHLNTQWGGADYDHHITTRLTPRPFYGPGAWPWSFLVSFYGLSTHQSIGRKDIKISVNV